MSTETGIDLLLAELDKRTSGKANDDASVTDRALFLLLKHFRDDLPPLESPADYQYFHKAFRQVDVLPSGELDMVAWLLLSRSGGVFWEVFEAIESSLVQDEAGHWVEPTEGE